MNKINGSCLCGAVSFEVVNTFEKLFFCSCDQCRQITGSAFASNLFVSITEFDWLGDIGNIVTYHVPGRDISKSFCRVCGSGVPWASGDGTMMIVPAGSLNEPVNVFERVRIFASEQPSWASDLAQVTTHMEFPK
ncbi:GFA family protein [Roseovarius sp. EL26]|uniref:GFA family protein n=1 Tax=Roseovarius sp. EL26 TaxID=2126672 RepID=UPI0013C5085D|nr:GFA family protein [Roseovarius sp. EL26]